MRRLFRSVMALFALGLATIGCTRSDSTSGKEEPINTPYQAAFRVPGMS